MNTQGFSTDVYVIKSDRVESRLSSLLFSVWASYPGGDGSALHGLRGGSPGRRWMPRQRGNRVKKREWLNHGDTMVVPAPTRATRTRFRVFMDRRPQVLHVQRTSAAAILAVPEPISPMQHVQQRQEKPEDICLAGIWRISESPTSR